MRFLGTLFAPRSSKNNNNKEMEEKELNTPNTETTNENLQQEEVQAENTENAETAAEEAHEPTIEEQLEAAQAEIAALNDKVLRQMAEFDNYRKRTLKEKAELILNGGEKTITALLPVMDDLDRALENMDKTDDVATLKEGVELIIQKLVTTLGAQGLKRMETQGQTFDTDFHEAVALVPGDESKKNQIIDCVQPGYLLNEKVIRHAKVVVGQ